MIIKKLKDWSEESGKGRPFLTRKGQENSI